MYVNTYLAHLDRIVNHKGEGKDLGHLIPDERLLYSSNLNTIVRISAIRLTYGDKFLQSILFTIFID